MAVTTTILDTKYLTTLLLILGCETDTTREESTNFDNTNFFRLCKLGRKQCREIAGGVFAISIGVVRVVKKAIVV